MSWYIKDLFPQKNVSGSFTKYSLFYGKNRWIEIGTSWVDVGWGGLVILGVLTSI